MKITHLLIAFIGVSALIWASNNVSFYSNIVG
jgi:hypothetical protein